MKIAHKIILVVAIFLIALFVAIPGRFYPYSGYKAVFLSNGQVYFGKLAWGVGEYATLSGIYYLRPGTSTTSGVEQLATQGGNLDLVKLGNEIHAPTDLMKIRKDDIVFYESLSSSGRVATAIAQFSQDSQAK